MQRITKFVLSLGGLALIVVFGGAFISNAWLGLSVATGVSGTAATLVWGGAGIYLGALAGLAFSASVVLSLGASAIVGA